ncbi:hypothetical protein MRY40_25435, partial [Escherichia coli]|nr:hypothetical protein [Escherichia coli]
DRNRSHWSTSKTPSYTKSVSWQHHLPVLDHIALGYSAKNFYETTNFMGQTVREFGASKITVWWGSIYAKIAYASLAGLIGYGVKVATDD